MKIEVLSRFRSKKQADEVVRGMRDGTVDVVIGTHRLLQHTKGFKDVGLVIVDEEHRFGVRHKEAIKSLRSQVDVLTLTATPIPRTLNMTLGGPERDVPDYHATRRTAGRKNICQRME